MAPLQSVIQRTFAGGELAPAFHARADLGKYQSGLRRCRNFIVQRQGGVSNRGGTRFVEACKTTSATVMLLRYVSEIEGESVLLELGNGYIRFYQNGAQLEIDLSDVDAYAAGTDYVTGDLVQDGGIAYYARRATIGDTPAISPNDWYPLPGLVYELPSPFGANLPNWNQSAKTITLTHRLVAPWQLTYEGLTRWVLEPVTTASGIAAPVGLALAVGTVGTGRAAYVVTAAAVDTYEESLQSAQIIDLAAADATEAAPNVLTWTAQASAAEFYVYADPVGNGQYGYVGTAGSNSFNDTGLIPDYSVTPPIPRALFTAGGSYPHVSAVHQQRRLFGQTVTEPDRVDGSRVGFPSNFDISQPLQDDDAISFKIAGNNQHAVRHMLSLKQLIVLTGAGAFTVGEPKVPLTPSTLSSDQESEVGISEIRPALVGTAALYVQARGVTIRDLQFDQQIEGFGGRDLSIFASHLFNGYAVRAIDFALESHSILWSIRSDGTLLGLTYLRDEAVFGWHRHDTGAGGAFEAVCVVPELNEDAVYLIVKRTIGAVTKRYIEKLEPHRENVAAADFDVEMFFVDSGLSYTGAPVNNVAGLGHLEGQIVAVVGDGAVVFNGDPAATNAADFTVTAGTLPVNLPASYSVIHAGLPIRYAEIESLDLDVAGEAVRDKKKRVGSLTVLLEASARTFKAGPDSSSLVAYQLEPSEQPADSFTGQVEIDLVSEFNDNGRVFLRQIDPLPITILGWIPNLEPGG